LCFCPRQPVDRGLNSSLAKHDFKALPTSPLSAVTSILKYNIRIYNMLSQLLHGIKALLQGWVQLKIDLSADEFFSKYISNLCGFFD
jgi:hypothetical protein